MKRSIVALALVATAATTVTTSAHAWGAREQGALAGVVAGVVLSNMAHQPRYYPVQNYPQPVYQQTMPAPMPYPAPVYQQSLPMQVPVYGGCGADGYFRGEYNPGAAAAYCRGAMEGQRIRQFQSERDAYYEGRRAMSMNEADAYRQGAARTPW